MIMPLGRNTKAGLTRLRHFNEVEDTGLLLIDGKRWGYGVPPARPSNGAGVQRFR